MRARPAAVPWPARPSRLRALLVRRTTTMAARRSSWPVPGSISPRDTGGERLSTALQPPMTSTRSRRGCRSRSRDTDTCGTGSGSGWRHQSAAGHEDAAHGATAGAAAGCVCPTSSPRDTTIVSPPPGTRAHVAREHHATRAYRLMDSGIPGPRVDPCGDRPTRGGVRSPVSCAERLSHGAELVGPWT